MNKSILYVGPSLNEVGGVSFYCKSILDKYAGDIEYFSFPIKMKMKPWLYIKVIIGLVVRVMKRKYDIVQFNTSFNTNAIVRDALLLLITNMINKNIVVFIHGWDVEFVNSITGIRKFVLISILNKATRILVLANEFRECLISLGVVTDIIVETTCYPEEYDGLSIDLRYKNNTSRILFISRIEKEKGVFELVDACSKLVENNSELQLDIAGVGPDFQELSRYINNKKLSFVNLHGAVIGQNKIDLFNKADIFCLPTYYGEGLPVTILEAMKFGLPVITCQTGGIVDVFNDGENGFYVQKRSVSDLRDKIRILLSDQVISTRISKNNISRSNDFSPRIVSERLLKLYSSI